MKYTIPSVISFVGLTIAALADPQTFDFKDPKGVNHATFTIDSPLETISGIANGISGTITVDPDKPEATSGTITVDAKSLHVENPLMQKHLMSEDWMDTKKHPKITFTVKSLKNFVMEGNKAAADVIGSFSVKGVEKEITAPATVVLLPGKLADRTGGKMKGDLAILRTTFIINRSDFNINPSVPASKVADKISVSLAIAGASPEK